MSRHTDANGVKMVAEHHPDTARPTCDDCGQDVMICECGR